MRIALPLLALCALALAAPAQTCSTLTTSGNIGPGETIGIQLTGADAESLALLAIGPDQGSTTLGGGPFSITLDLDRPFAILPLGMTDMNGDASLNIDIPAGISPNALPSSDLYLQAATFSTNFTPGGGGMGPSFGFTACLSNVATLSPVAP